MLMSYSETALERDYFMTGGLAMHESFNPILTICPHSSGSSYFRDRGQSLGETSKDGECIDTPASHAII